MVSQHDKNPNWVTLLNYKPYFLYLSKTIISSLTTTHTQKKYKKLDTCSSMEKEKKRKENPWKCICTLRKRRASEQGNIFDPTFLVHTSSCIIRISLLIRISKYEYATSIFLNNIKLLKYLLRNLIGNWVYSIQF